MLLKRKKITQNPAESGNSLQPCEQLACVQPGLKLRFGDRQTETSPSGTRHLRLAVGWRFPSARESAKGGSCCPGRRGGLRGAGSGACPGRAAEGLASSSELGAPVLHAQVSFS